jgi:hypothetical protein
MDKVNWRNLSRNPNAIHLLATLDTDEMNKQNLPFKQDLEKDSFKPSRLFGKNNMGRVDNMSHVEYIEKTFDPIDEHDSEFY